MPLVDRRAGLTPANMRNADVAHRLTESIMPLVQAKTQSAFRVQGIEAVLYSKLTQGRRCICHSKNPEAARLSPDGKASTGAINRILTGNSNFGISNYNPFDNDLNIGHELVEMPKRTDQWALDTNNVGGEADEEFNQVEFEPTVGDNGQFSPDFEDLFNGFDMSALGLSDISCPICFGTSYVGGYTPFRAWRSVLLGSDLNTASYFDLPSFELQPGTHTVTVTLPRGAVVLDVFRTMCQDKVTVSKFYLDGVDVTSARLLDYCDGTPRELKIVTEQALTHLEMQFGLSHEPIYFEFPKLTKSSDLSLLEQQEPFQIIVSPDIPALQTLDVIAESMHGKLLIVQNANPWNTRNKNMLGFECQVRVAQPQELWNILPRRRHVTGQKRVRIAAPTNAKATSGLSTVKGGFTF